MTFKTDRKHLLIVILSVCGLSMKSYVTCLLAKCRVAVCLYFVLFIILTTVDHMCQFTRLCCFDV